MPQIWMTYAEAGELLGCTDAEARARAIDLQWPRKRSHDGQSRLMLPDAAFRTFMERQFQQRLGEMMAASDVVHEMQAKAHRLAVELRKAA